MLKTFLHGIHDKLFQKVVQISLHYINWMGGSRLHDEIILDGRVYTFMTSQDWKKESVLHDKTGLDGRVRPS